MLYISKLSTVVGQNFSRMLPEKFALILDRKTMPEANYFAVFATFSKEGAFGYGSASLAFSPSEDETSQSADEHTNILGSVPSVSRKSSLNIISLIGDSSKVNRLISTKKRIPLLGCAKHRFRLAVWEFFLRKTISIFKQIS